MFELPALLNASKEALSLVTQVAHFLEKEQEFGSGNKSIAVIMAEVRIGAKNVSKEFAERLRGMLIEFQNLHVDLDRPLSDIMNDLRWYNFLTRHRLITLRNRFQQMYQQLTSFIDDVMTILICAQSVGGARYAFQYAMEGKHNLDRAMQEKTSVKDLLNLMIAWADHFGGHLGS